MTEASPSQSNPSGVDLRRVGPSRAGMLMDASVSVGFTYGYSQYPASRDATHPSGLTEGGSYISAHGPISQFLLAPATCLPVSFHFQDGHATSNYDTTYPRLTYCLRNAVSAGVAFLTRLTTYVKFKTGIGLIVRCAKSI